MTDTVRLMSADEMLTRMATITYDKCIEECEDSPWFTLKHTSFIYLIILQHTIKVLSSAGIVKLIFLKQIV